ncbi:hypothetical protein F2P56_024783 [Juglans regia]|uniref:Glutaredoxin domain-containing protein n=2 Tax=Juglans regia TaxID=51240 RepID=A0A833TUZ2_JUGRE|nr:monothiol glutaredoxin-S1-like [Juglans regia]KAF5455180.1 hypothetical protein F2P56_024783 [Juglans regia]
METVRRLVGEYPVVIFSNRSSSCLSLTVKSVIGSFGANPKVYELDQVPDGPQIQRALQQLGCQENVPAVFIGQRLIGGSKEVNSLLLRNELEPLLREARAIWV